jgi:peptide/nickel transport system ATP-binding protein
MAGAEVGAGGEAGAGGAPGDSVLEVRELAVGFPTRDGPMWATRSVSLSLSRGETLALVGESGSGKSTTGLAIMGLVPPPGRVTGQIRLLGREVNGLERREWRRLRGREVAMVFQDPGTSLNPVLPVGGQIEEVLRTHLGLARRAARERAVELLHRVGIPNPRERSRDHPATFSGGERQRVMIAAALAGEPAVLIADEPTSALDVTTQARIADLLLELREETGVAILWVSHDLSLMSRVADRVAVMERGHTVESGPAIRILEAPQHPATRRLVAAVRPMGLADREGPASTPFQGAPPAPPRDTEDGRGGPDPVAVLTSVSRTVGGRRRIVGPDRPGHPAVVGVSLEVGRGEAVGVVGESGAGKTTLGRIVAGLAPLDAGRLQTGGARVQMVFQNPLDSLNPRYTVEWLVREPLRLRGTTDGVPTPDLLESVGLSPDFATRFPWQLSGGESQRVAIARALAPDPGLIVLDEPVSALDSTTRNRILDLLARLREERGVAFLLISHDFGVVSRFCDRVAVMQAGRIVEMGPTNQVLRSPRHPHTRELLAAAGIPAGGAAGAPPRGTGRAADRERGGRPGS